MSPAHKFSNFNFFSRRILIFLCLPLILGIILEIWLANRLSTSGEEINKLERLAINLRMQNQQLKNQIDEKSSLIFISSQAQKLGFDKISKIQYLKASDLALNN